MEKVSAFAVYIRDGSGRTYWMNKAQSLTGVFENAALFTNREDAKAFRASAIESNTTFQILAGFDFIKIVERVTTMDIDII